MSAAAAPLEVVRAPLDTALGAVLAEPLAARTDLPPFDAAAMDGWAVSGIGPWEALPARDRGSRYDEPQPLLDGTAIPVHTGEQLPPGCSGVLRREQAVVEQTSYGPRLLVGDADTATPSGRPGYVEPGTDVRPRGQECREGDVLLEPGGVVTPAVVGLAAAAGHDELVVVRPPVVGLLVLGDELLSSGPARHGKVRDALGPLVPAWVAALGSRCNPPIRVPDTVAELQAALDDANVDVVVTTGSTARSTADHLHTALAALGADLLVDTVAVRPGHPMLLAALPDGRFVVGLPGNPLAAVSALVTLLAPLLASLRGESGADLAAEPDALLTAEVTSHPAYTRLVPVIRERGELSSSARPVPAVGPAMLRGLALGDALAVVPPSGGARGSLVEILPLP